MNSAEPIRQRPGMWVGDTRDGRGILHMLWEVVANSLDEHLAGRCTVITVEQSPDGSIAVEDNGRGIPLTLIEGIPFAQRALTSFHDTPTLDGHAPHEHIGKVGLGLFPVCALSSRLHLLVKREGRAFSQVFERGIAVSTLRDEGPSTTTGTRVTFLPDPLIFQPNKLSADRISTRLRELSYLLPNLSFEFRARGEQIFREPRGLVALLDARTSGSLPALPTFASSGTSGQIVVETAARWTSRTERSIESFANIERTDDGGAHVRGLVQGLLAGLKQAAPQLRAAYPARALSRVLARGLNAIVCVRLADPTYDRPTKSRLVTPEAGFAVKNVITTSFSSFLNEEPRALQYFESVLKTTG